MKALTGTTATAYRREAGLETGMASKWAERTDGRPNAPWPAEMLAGRPWILVPADRALLSSFNRPSRNAVMSWAERQIADTVLAEARRIAGGLADGCWWLWPDGRTAPIREAGPTWATVLSRQRFVLWLDD
jgi:hypothetical protein